MKDKEWNTEQEHFDRCRALIAQNIAVYETEAEGRHKETQELFKAVQAGDAELYDQLMTSASLEETCL